MKTKSELIDKALRIAKKAANGGKVMLQVDGMLFYDSIQTKQETWRERNLRRQAEGVKFEKRGVFNPQKWVSSSRGWTFNTKEENYREIKPKTETIWFAIGAPIHSTGDYGTFSSNISLPDLLAKMTRCGFDPLGKIESREVEIKA